MSGSDDLNDRRARLKAMRARYQRSPDQDIGDETDWGDTETEDFAPVGDEVLGGPAERPAKRGGRGGDQAAMMRRVSEFLTQGGAGGKFVPGTNIREDRLKQAVQFLRHRTRMAQGNRGKRMQRLLQYLTQESPGDPVVSGVNIARLKNVMGLLERRGQPSARGGGGPRGPRGGRPRQREVVSENDLELDLVDELEDTEQLSARESIEAGKHGDVIESTLQQLVGITSRLSAQLEETQKQVDQIAREKAQSGSNSVEHTEAARDEGQPDSGQARSGRDWFTEYLE